jgi:hypothetical protein
MLGFAAPQLFSLPPWANTGIAMANIIAAMTSATTTNEIMRLMRPLLSPMLHSGAFVGTLTSVGKRHIPQMRDFVAYYDYKRVISGVLDACSAYSPKCVEKLSKKSR